MRKRAAGRFRAEEYDAHCEMGGHPRLKGHVLLRDHLLLASDDQRASSGPAALWCDLAQHVERLWANYAAGVVQHSPPNVYVERFAEISGLFEDWRAKGGGPGRI
jgi:hypothetical protein